MDGLITGKHAKQYELNYKRSNQQYKENTFLNRVIPKGAIVADFCSGTGLGIEFVIKKASKVYGIEASRDMLAIAHKKFKNNTKVQLINSSVQKTPLKSNSIDVVLIRMGLHHIDNKGAVICEAHRILKSQGIFIVMDLFSICNNRIVNYIIDRTQDTKRNHSFNSLYYCTISYFKTISQNHFRIKSIGTKRKGMLFKANIILEKI